MDKLKLYKTAYSPLYECFVRIVNVRFDANKEPIIDAWVDDKLVLFRVSELTDFCL